MEVVNVRWQGRRKSSNVDDRRGRGSPSKGMVGGGLGIIILIIFTLLGGNPDVLLNNDIIN